jgi:hypothetical protein
MNRVMVFGGLVAGLVVLALATGHRDRERGDDRDLQYQIVRGLHLATGHRDLAPGDESAAATSHGAIPATSEAHEGLLHGRVTMENGDVFEGRLRWGGDEEALWSNYFNGFKAKNPWAGLAPSEALPKEGLAFEVFGIKLSFWERQNDLGRPFMVRFGDIARIEPRGRDLRVTLRSGTVVHLDRYAADDVADGVRVWDGSRGVVDVGEWGIRSIELLASAPGAGPLPLYGTVRTRQGDFTGLIQWDRQACLGSDVLDGYTADGEPGLRFETIRTIARRSQSSILATVVDGREIELSDARENGQGHRGIYVDDERYGRVLVSWDAFERVDFSPGGTGPAYDAFPAGRPLTGTVLTRSGRQLAGRLVYDLDESETNETLDAPSLGVDYTIPFSLIASIALPGLDEPGLEQARVTLRIGEELRLELAGDLGELNAGMLIFIDGSERPEYVPWADVRQVDFGDPLGG